MYGSTIFLSVHNRFWMWLYWNEIFPLHLCVFFREVLVMCESGLGLGCVSLHKRINVKLYHV